MVQRPGHFRPVHHVGPRMSSVPPWFPHLQTQGDRAWPRRTSRSFFVSSEHSGTGKHLTRLQGLLSLSATLQGVNQYQLVGLAFHSEIHDGCQPRRQSIVPFSMFWFGTFHKLDAANQQVIIFQRRMTGEPPAFTARYTKNPPQQK